ncbi:MAG: hypothetical protein AAFV54_13390 [Pseudomonadota bacterium]
MVWIIKWLNKSGRSLEVQREAALELGDQLSVEELDRDPELGETRTPSVTER